ncbi:MAG TPA: iron ABC transporter permease, partial [Deltaproteobacteria bacterium]|nr:iron ABC transporter permease [Deltaproteobacteria bacterium]
MHLADGHIPPEYSRYIGRKTAFILAGLFLLAGLLILSLSLGAVSIAPPDVLRTLSRVGTNQRFDLIILGIRLPQALAAVMAGAGLAVSGAVMQSILRNPLGSPFTLGLSHAAAFGAAFSVMAQGSLANAGRAGTGIWAPYLTTGSAFFFSILAAVVIIMISRTRGATPEVMVLSGIAMGSLFTAGTMFLQFFADDVELASMVYWTFGDTARASWSELGLAAAVTLAVCLYFLANAWNYNAVSSGDRFSRLP